MPDLMIVGSASLVCVTGVVSPGPNFVAVTHRAMSSRRIETIAFVLGIASVNVLWASLALFGVNAILETHSWLFSAVKIAGGLYLMSFGIRLIGRSKSTAALESSDARVASTALLGLRDGLITNLSNPKSLVFYVSVFSSVVPQGVTLDTQLALLAMVAAVALAWYGGLGLTLSIDSASVLYRAASSLIEKCCGATLVGFGLFHVLGSLSA